MVEPKKHFSDGEEVEVGNDDEGFLGSWYVGTVIQTLQPPLEKENKVLLVEFHTIMENGSSSKRLREAVDPQLVRPRPPLQLEDHSFQLYQSVDAFVYDGWWRGTISQVLENQRYKVLLTDSQKEMEIQQSDLRCHLDWINERWVHPQELCQDSEVSQPAKKLKALDEVKTPPTLKACGHPSAEGYSSDLPSTAIGMEQKSVVNVETVKQRIKIKIIPPKPRREALVGNVAEQQEVEKISEHPMNDIEQRSTPRRHYKKLHKEGTQRKVPASLGEQAMINTETTSFAIQGEDREKVIEMDGACASNDVRNSDESCLPPDTGVSADSQPTTQTAKADTCKDSSVGDLEVQDSLDVKGNSIILEGTTADTQLEEAMGDDQNECILLSVSVDTPEKEGLPYVKSPLAQKIVESLEILRVMPQQLHFRSLEGLNAYHREGMAIGSLLNFANIVEQIGKIQAHCPLSVLQEMYEALPGLEDHGYNVQPVQARLQELIRIKNEQEQLYRELRAVEEEFNKEQREELQLKTEIDEMGKELVEVTENLIHLNKKMKSIANDKEIKGKNLSEVVSTIETIKERIDDSKQNYENVSTSWMKNLQGRS